MLHARHQLENMALAHIVVGKLKHYPRMLVTGQVLPPFISPACHSNPNKGVECERRWRHSCHGKELAICVSLVELFYSRTSVNAAFVWDTIYREVERLLQDVSYAFEALESCHADDGIAR